MMRTPNNLFLNVFFIQKSLLLTYRYQIDDEYQGAIGLDLSDYSDENDIKFIKNVFNSLGKTVLVAEDKLNAVTGISGSAPAYFYLFLKGIINAGGNNMNPKTILFDLDGTLLDTIYNVK